MSATATAPLLEATGLKAGYGTSQVLHGVDFHVGAGESVAVLGPNGTGKSTLLRALSGTLRRCAGSVTFRDSEIRGTAPTDIVGRGLVHVPEGRHVFPGMSVRDNLLLGAHLAPNDIADRMASVVDLFPVLGQRMKQSAETLSGGEQQMLAIGRGLMANPVLLMLDEPTLGLAPVVVEEVVSRLLGVTKEFNTSLLLVEQRVYIARELCSRHYMMVNGRIVKEVHGGVDSEADLLSSYVGAGSLSKATAPEAAG
jgi:branched-chain amino acid transport system ATP-binding protein